MNIFVVTFFDSSFEVIGSECFRLLDRACSFATSATVLDGFYCSPKADCFLVEKKRLLDDDDE